MSNRGFKDLEELKDEKIAKINSPLTPTLSRKGRGRKNAFTLAEVLITLGIIGVVAAMTMPSLIENHKKKEYSSRLKKFYSYMEQAIRLSEVEHGDMEDWQKANWKEGYDDDGKMDYEKNGIISKQFFLTYFAPYIKFTSIKDAVNITDDEGERIETQTKVYLSDSSTLYIWNGGCFDFRLDVNGDSKPNVFGKDIYTFTSCINKNYRRIYCGDEKIKFCAISENINLESSREDVLNVCKENPFYCARFLQINNWEYPDDYPYKL